MTQVYYSSIPLSTIRQKITDCLYGTHPEYFLVIPCIDLCSAPRLGNLGPLFGQLGTQLTRVRVPVGRPSRLSLEARTKGSTLSL